MADVADQKPVAEAVAEEAAPAVASAEVQSDDTQGQDTPATEPEEDIKSKKVTLADLTARATALYARKEYDEAADVYATAAEKQADINGGDIHPDNAEILFLYGRSLFRVGQTKSDVLGAKAPATDNKTEKSQPKSLAPKKAPASSAAAEAGASKTEQEKVAQEGVAAVAGATETDNEKKSFFQFQGDENFDDEDSDEEEQGDGEAEGEEEEEDDMQAAHNILELARLSLEKRLEQLEQEDGASSDKGKEVSQGDTSTVRHVKERLADTHDLLAEISLENERFPEAIMDSRESLKLKKTLFPPESEVLAEAHFKLSLALEFASVTTTNEEDGPDSEKAAFDENLRGEAISELEAAIESTRLKLQAKEVELAQMANPEDNVATKASINDVKDIIEDMEQRLKDMKKPPVDLQATLEAATGSAMQGMFGSALGESAAQTEARVEEAKKSATDLSGLVRKKKRDDPAAEGDQTNGHESNGTKRKAEEDAAGGESPKKAKVDEVKAEE